MIENKKLKKFGLKSLADIKDKVKLNRVINNEIDLEIEETVNTQLTAMFDNWIKNRNLDRKKRRKLYLIEMEK